MTGCNAPFNGRTFSALLFDMDGTLLSSIEAAERVWTRWAAGFGIDARTFLHDIHGRRAVDSVRRLNIPGVDPVAEAEAITLAEIEDIEGVHAVAGAKEFVMTLPDERWAIVTSAPRALAVRRLEAAGLPTPEVFITAEDIPRGKPDPACYQLAASRLGFAADDCLIFEDAAAGIRAAEAAGGAVVVIAAIHHRPIETAHPTCQDFQSLRVTMQSDGRIQITQTAHHGKI
jgi:sugar-phosphatase